MKKTTLEIAQKMHADLVNLTLNQVAKKYGLYNYESVRRVLKRYGLSTTPESPRFRRYEFLQAELGYIAGVIDGEGHIAKKYMRVSVSNTSLPLMEWLKTRIGGCLYKKTIIKTTTTQCYGWDITGAKARGLLVVILPFLLVKKDKAKEFLQ